MVVTGTIQPANEFRVMTERGEVPVLDVVSGGHYHRQYVDDPEMREYFVSV
jgi:hypothetical protein